MILRLLSFRRPSRSKKINQENPYVHRHHLRDLKFALGNSVGKNYEVLSQCHSEVCRKKHLQ